MTAGNRFTICALVASAFSVCCPILKISQSGEITGIVSGLTTVTGLTLDTAGRLYALELSATAGFPSPGEGKLVRVHGSGRLEDIVTHLVVPTVLTTGPDGALYISKFWCGSSWNGPDSSSDDSRLRVLLTVETRIASLRRDEPLEWYNSVH